MKKNRKDKFIKQPYYPGGMKAMRDFVRRNLRYPADALKNKIEGTVHLRYSIDRKGKVYDPKIVSGIGYGCDEEAGRIVSLFEFEMPKNRVGKIIFHKTLQVHFRLPKESEQEQEGLEIKYTFKEGQSSGYGYSIEI